MGETTSNRDITFWLRGVAIFVVVVSHFFYLYDLEFYEQWVNNYANAFVAVFFVVAGFGAYYSLEKRFGSHEEKNNRVILKYFWDRATYIYPIYWISLAATYLLDKEFFFEHKLDLIRNIGMIIAAPVSLSPYWFVVAIVQCYLFAPLLYLVFRWLRLKYVIALNALMLFIVLLFSFHYLHIVNLAAHLLSYEYADPSEPYVLLDRGIFLGNVLLFSLGMMMPPLISRFGARFNKRTFYYVSLMLLIGFSVFLRYDARVFHRAILESELVYYLLVFAFCLFALTASPALPLRKLFVRFGKLSYSIYLLHWVFFVLLVNVGLFRAKNPYSILITVATFPFFVLFCTFLEKQVARLRARYLRYSGVPKSEGLGEKASGGLVTAD